MKKLEERTYVEQEVVSTVCDVCGTESVTVDSWDGKHRAEFTLYLMQDQGDTYQYEKAEFCPSCANTVVDFVRSLGGTFHNV